MGSRSWHIATVTPFAARRTNVRSPPMVRSESSSPVDVFSNGPSTGTGSP